MAIKIKTKNEKNLLLKIDKVVGILVLWKSILFINRKKE